MMKQKAEIGSSFEAFLDEEGVSGTVNAKAIKKVLSWQLQQAMKDGCISKNKMAKAMQTSRSQLDRVLDPKNDKVQLDTVIKAAEVLGKRLKIELI